VLQRLVLCPYTIRRYADAMADLHAEVLLYTTRRRDTPENFACLCAINGPEHHWEAHIDLPLVRGRRQRVGFVFLSGQKAADELRAAGKFYLYEVHKRIGEAIVQD
jgi:hypothetical protein